MTMLIILGGLPGVGKTTIARELARQLGAVHIRIDSIEQAIRESGVVAVSLDDAGYRAGYAIARDNLGLGHRVIADCVNPLPVTREAWRTVAADTASRIVEVEIVCSDIAEHRRRVEQRSVDVPGLVPPTWASVQRHDYAPWTTQRLVIDTATLSAREAAQSILSHVRD